METTFEVTFNLETGMWGYDVRDENDEWLYSEMGFESYEQAFRWGSKHHRWAGEGEWAEKYGRYSA